MLPANLHDHRSASAPTLKQQQQQPIGQHQLRKRLSCVNLHIVSENTKSVPPPLDLTATSPSRVVANQYSSLTLKCDELQCRRVNEKRGVFRPVSVDEYKFTRCLGHGASGKVKLCRNNQGVKLAVKVMHTATQSSRFKYRDEAEHLFACRGHENVVNFVEFLTTERKKYLVTEYVSGCDLWDFVDRHKCLSENVAKNLFRQLIMAVKHVHDCGVGHRDIKPENILVTKDGETIKLCDFGFSVKYQKGQALVAGTMGTVRCLAPEMIKRKGWEYPIHDPFKADIWSCATVLYHMLSGSFPFEVHSDRQTLINTVQGVVINPLPQSVSPQARDLLKKMFHLTPSARPSPEEILAHPFFA